MSDHPSPVVVDDLNVFKFFELFPDEQVAIDYLEAQRWPGCVICPRGNSDYTSPIKNRNRHSCNACRRQFSVRAGSVFENSRISLRKWIYVMYAFQSARKGISSAQLARDLGIRQGTAWFMMHRLREAMEPDLELLKGEIEIDEASGYQELGRWFEYDSVNHGKGEYVRESVTTNSIESVWAIVKRAHKGIYHQWPKKHGHR